MDAEHSPLSNVHGVYEVVFIFNFYCPLNKKKIKKTHLVMITYVQRNAFPCYSLFKKLLNNS
ncbi:hypothetical protein C0J52_25912 [Blattella germanica]|nr:hypothetical protein C0J52_25912 [Blattella germanica]